MEPFDTIDRIRLKDRHAFEDVQELRSLTISFPMEPELWDVLGDIMQICDSEIPIQESVKCYRQALKCDPTYASAYESLGWALDSHFNDFDNARRNFEIAISYGAGDSARIGLARVLAQMGETVDANQSLAECDDKTRADWIEMSREIREGLWYSGDDKTM
ncbi:MAG: tetratricopeptide repeat protein [Pirellula sp.]|jgi:tetratricopeptide (TPR) repeat protein|nr:tetratricopeptide repeat protein [Pirellula sp.]